MPVVPIPLPEIAGFLDALLRISEVPDSTNALNGLQVECHRPIGRIIAACWPAKRKAPLS